MRRMLIAIVLVMLCAAAAAPAAFASGGTTSALPGGTVYGNPTIDFTFDLTDPHGISSATIILADSVSGAVITQKSATLSWAFIRYDDPETGDYWMERDFTKATARVQFTGVQDRKYYAAKVKIKDRSYAYQTLTAGVFQVNVVPKLTAIPHVVYGSDPWTTRFPFTGYDNSTVAALQGRVWNFGGPHWTSYDPSRGQICWTGSTVPASGLSNYSAALAAASYSGAEGVAVDGTTLLPGITDKVRRYDVGIRFQDNYPSTPTVPSNLTAYNYPVYLATPDLAGDVCESCHTSEGLAAHLDHCGACHGDGGPVGYMGVEFPEYAEPVHDASVFANCVGCHHSQYAIDIPQCPVCP
ncbi:MAG TPA: cytochrome c3 family protein [Coriobacteriia bacterium]|nr:cytochrome c3 family protein [Coriobacteriia bacterium]